MFGLAVLVVLLAFCVGLVVLLFGLRLVGTGCGLAAAFVTVGVGAVHTFFVGVDALGSGHPAEGPPIPYGWLALAFLVVGVSVDLIRCRRGRAQSRPCSTA